ncbi:hypothetical protein T03_476 [Trichinella britovi]|uniref:Uncharacterized protein n=1 Tax=Trichinella britovi TaxID=45882 RepID=A0A0V1DBZ7_TRIBR|nr:hypothetical protein T03_476 [Trichinella britovi]
MYNVNCPLRFLLGNVQQLVLGISARELLIILMSQFYHIILKAEDEDISFLYEILHLPSVLKVFHQKQICKLSKDYYRVIVGKVVQFAYHQLGVGGDVVVDDEHLLAMFEVIFESDGSADGEAKFAEQGLGTAVSGHRDHIPTLPVHGHGYRPFGQAFGKTKTAASGADAEQHNFQIFRIRHKQRVHVGFQIFDQSENGLELFGMAAEVGRSLLTYSTQLVQGAGDDLAGSTIAEHVRYGVAHAPADQLPVSGTGLFCSKLHRLIQGLVVNKVRQQKFQNLFQVFLFDQLQLILVVHLINEEKKDTNQKSLSKSKSTN